MHMYYVAIQQQYFTEMNIAVLEQYLYSPDLLPCGFFSFHQAQEDHQVVETIKRAVTTELSGIPEDFFQQWIETFLEKNGKVY